MYGIMIHPYATINNAQSLRIIYVYYAHNYRFYYTYNSIINDTYNYTYNYTYIINNKLIYNIKR